MRNGDIVANKINGIVGTVIKTYTPTACGEQVMIKTLDGRKYHAPTVTWVKLKIGIDQLHDVRQMLMRTSDQFPGNVRIDQLHDVRQMLMAATGESEEKYLNPYGEYVLTFARNHGITIEEAYEQPMVKARREYFERTGR